MSGGFHAVSSTPPGHGALWNVAEEDRPDCVHTPFIVDWTTLLAFSRCAVEGSDAVEVEPITLPA